MTSEEINTRILEEPPHVSQNDFDLTVLKTLERIADSLSSIEQHLDVLTELSDCVGVMPPQYKNGTSYSFLRIGGSVDTGV